jgi:carbon monoxide dehydrogenase subunit G
MEFKGRYSILAPPDAVWAALHDPSVLAKVIPGCEGVERISDTEFRARAQLKIGPVKARFEGKVSLAPHAPEAGFSHALTLKGEGQGGAAGFAKGESEVRLARENGGTVLTYDAKANVGGRLAQVGQRLIDGAAKAIADEFFANFAKEMKPAAVEPGTSSVPHPPQKSDEEGLAPQVWVIGLIAVVLILLTVFSVVL